MAFRYITTNAAIIPDSVKLATAAKIDKAVSGIFLNPFQSLNLSVNIPSRLPQILDHIALFACPPQVFNRITTAEIEVFRDLDALHA